MNLRRTLSALVDWLAPAHETEEASDRAHFLVQVWLLIIVVCVIFAPLNLWSGMWAQHVLTVALLATGTVVLVLLRTRGPLAVASQLSLAALCLSFGASALMQTPLDATNLLGLAVVPLMSTYLMPRYSVAWVGIASTTGGAVLFLGSRGVTVPITDPAPLPSGMLNITVAVAAIWVLSRRFDQLRRAALERMQQADRAKNIFLATIGHEIRTPMNGVLGMTEVMLEEAQSPIQREQLEVIQRSGRGLVSLINDLLDLSKLEARKLRVESVPFELRQVLGDIELLATPLALKKGLRLIIELDDVVPSSVRGDGQRLTQVLNNLLNNAIKFTREGEVRLSISVHDRRLRFEVRDTGPGIEADVLPRLFTAFEQADGSSTRRHGGTGLGLAISRQLVELMGGRLEVSSTPGKGSTFWFAIDLEPVSVAAATTSPATRPRALHRSRVLVVDDNPVNLRVAASLVEKAGFHAVAAPSGAKALELARDEDIALVLMDCHMPEMDGFETTERLHASSRGARVPVVALTASATPDDVDACLRAGMIEVLAKPIQLASLREVLERHLGAQPSTPEDS